MFDVLFEVVTWLLNPLLFAEIVEVCFIHSPGMNLSGIASQFAMQNRSFAMRN